MGGNHKKILRSPRLPEISIPGSYPYGKEFEEACLALLVQQPQDALGIIEPANFNNPVFVDIARIAKEACQGEDLSTFRLRFRSLWPLVLDGARLDTRHKSHLKPIYRRAVRRIFKLALPDKPALLEKVSDWTREKRARETLVAIEKDITAKRTNRAGDRAKELVTLLDTSSTSAADNREAERPRLVDFPSPFYHPDVAESGWLIENFIPDKGLTMGVGVPESGKSLLALLMLDSAARGVPFLGHESPSRRFALYIDTENGLAEMLRRCRIFEIRTCRLYFWCLDDPQFGAPPKDPLDPTYLRLAKKYRCPMVFDSLQYFADGKINNAEDAAPILQKFKLLAARWGIPVYLLHHSSDKDPKNTYLGTTLIRATLDAGHSIVAKKDPSDPALRYITLSSLKSRRGGGMELAVQVNWRTGEYEEWQSPTEGLRKKLAKILERNPCLSERQAAETLGVTRWKLRQLLGKK